MCSREVHLRVLGILLLFGVIVLVACQAASTPSPAPQLPQATAPAPTSASQPTSPSIASVGQPRKGGTIVVPITEDPATLLTATSTDSVVMQIGGKIFSPMVVNDKSFAAVPDSALAESWEVTPDGLTYTFHLHKGVKWQDGHPLTCDDVKFTFEQVMPKYNPNGGANYGTLKSVTCKDDVTAIFNLSAPYAPLLMVMQADGGAVVPKHLYEGTDILNNPYNLKPVGSGPFMLQEWVRGDHITLVRNPNYFMKGRPFLDKIIFKVIPQSESAVQAFEAGEIDYIPDIMVNRTDVLRLEKMSYVQIGKNLEPPKRLQLFFNLKDCKICADINVRKAISAAIDRQVLIDLTQMGLATPVYNPIPPAYAWAYNKDVSEPKFDLAAANKMLDDAGYKRGADGTRFSLSITYDANNAVVIKPVEVIKEQLKAVGINLTLKPLEKAVLFDQVFGKYTFEIFPNRYTTGGDPAIGIARTYRCADIDPTKQWVNNSRYCNKRVDELFGLASGTVDQTARAKYYYELQKILVDEMASVDLYSVTTTEIARKDFAGLFEVAWPADVNWDWVWWTKGEPMPEGSYDLPFWMKN